MQKMRCFSSNLPFRGSGRRRFLRLLASGMVMALTPAASVQGSLLDSPVGVNLLRPPGAVEEELFPAKCIRCGRCVEVCPYRSIVPLDARYGVHAGTPAVFVAKIPCYLCMKCVEVCPTGTLRRMTLKETRMGLAEIDKHVCVTWRDEGLCRTCYNVCPLKEEAIKLDELRPYIVEEACTGCGICVHGCPVAGDRGRKAVNIHPIYSTRQGRG